MVLTEISIDRKDKAHFFKKGAEKGSGSLPNGNSITKRSRSRALAAWLSALVLVGSGEQCPGKQGVSRGTRTQEGHHRHGVQGFSVWVTHEVTVLGLRSQP